MGIISLIYMVAFFILTLVLLVSISVLKNEKIIGKILEQNPLKIKKNGKNK